MEAQGRFVPFLDPYLLNLSAALAIGLLLGVERGWSLRGEAEGSRVAGIRTFVLLALTGGVSGAIAIVDSPLIGTAMVAAAATILLVAYAGELRRERDATSAVAAMLTPGLVLWRGLGAPASLSQWRQWGFWSSPCAPNCIGS